MERRDGDEQVLAEARALFAAFRWRECVELLTDQADEPLDGDGLTLLGEAAYLVGLDERAETAFSQAHTEFLDAGDLRAAARSAMRAAFVLENAGDAVRSGAWAARAARLVEENHLGGAEAGWVLAHRAHHLLAEQRLP
jgi:hypothetical protein